MKRVVVVGGSGFVGSQVIRSLNARDVHARGVKSPRLLWCPSEASPLERRVNGPYFDNFVSVLRQHRPDVVVNSAGVADALSGDAKRLFGANAATVAFVAKAAREAGIHRFIQVSSAAVQGRQAVLDSSEAMAALTPYAESKALGETLALKYGPSGTVIYRPAGVHGITRRVTQSVARYARSPLAIVGTRNAPTPQALTQNVADAIAFLALSDSPVPRRVHHPAEGITVGSLLEALGGKAPLDVPLLALARPLMKTAGGRYGGHARRLEMLWFGQGQSRSWLTTAGWLPPIGQEGWHQLGAALQRGRSDPSCIP